MGADGVDPRIVVVDPVAGTVTDVRVVERLRLARRGAGESAARRLADALVPGSTATALDGGEHFMEALARAASDHDGSATTALDGERLLTPVDAPAMRDFMAFEQHVINAAGRAGGAVDDAFYELPIHYRGNHTALIAHDDEVPWPGYAARMDYELELGVVIGGQGRDLTPDEAIAKVFGVTILNDFSLRDIQMREMRGMLGPAKAKHFASAVGPWITTIEAIDPADLEMTASVNGARWSTGSTATMMWSVAELVAWASSGEALTPGELLGSGTVGFGCGLELDRELRAGDDIALEIEGLGVLRNRIGSPRALRWEPVPRSRLLEEQR